MKIVKLANERGPPLPMKRLSQQSEKLVRFIKSNQKFKVQTELIERQIIDKVSQQISQLQCQKCKEKALHRLFKSNAIKSDYSNPKRLVKCKQFSDKTYDFFQKMNSDKECIFHSQKVLNRSALKYLKHRYPKQFGNALLVDRQYYQLFLQRLLDEIICCQECQNQIKTLYQTLFFLQLQESSDLTRLIYHDFFKILQGDPLFMQTKAIISGVIYLQSLDTFFLIPNQILLQKVVRFQPKIQSHKNSCFSRFEQMTLILQTVFASILKDNLNSMWRERGNTDWIQIKIERTVSSLILENVLKQIQEKKEREEKHERKREAEREREEKLQKKREEQKVRMQRLEQKRKSINESYLRFMQAWN